MTFICCTNTAVNIIMLSVLLPLCPLLFAWVSTISCQIWLGKQPVSTAPAGTLQQQNPYIYKKARESKFPERLGHPLIEESCTQRSRGNSRRPYTTSSRKRSYSIYNVKIMVYCFFHLLRKCKTYRRFRVRGLLY